MLRLLFQANVFEKAPKKLNRTDRIIIYILFYFYLYCFIISFHYSQTLPNILVFRCLFIKTWTLYKVYRSAEQLKKTTLTPMYIIKGIGLYLVVELVSYTPSLVPIYNLLQFIIIYSLMHIYLILIIWTAVDRPGVVYHRI